MTVLAATATRRVVGAAATLALGAGLAAATTGTAEAATGSSTRARAVSVDSTVVVSADGLSVRSAVSASTDDTYVESRLTGRLTLACFAGGQVVRGSGSDGGVVVTGDLAGAPWYDNGYLVDAVAPAGTTSVSAPVVLKNVLRDRAGDLAAKPCAAGQTAGFYRYRVTGLASQRHAFDGTVVAHDASWRAVSYYFPAPAA
ncbi:hypothetical protein [Kineococcus rhizosphaerae]|uniref:Tat pathway signal sequence domain protein n=1 Tax=Kineococcus rhizosphaerae TaxID=559628 RepID=A0A2T0R9H5_9ACTN|nr:hypothetical protein [Kineococcus rhizosphaerae]PRY17817.1 hypothetical protein CLV37_10153 [Kineococcus rhizosphaerae]